MPDAPLSEPVTLTSTYIADADGSMPPGRVYARASQPNWEALESTLAQLEGAESAFAFSSGAAAMDAALSLVEPGGTVIMHRHGYAGTFTLADAHAAARDVRVVRVDFLDPASLAGLVVDGPALLWAESCTNPMIEAIDLPALARMARRLGALFVVDNTFSTPLTVRPLAHGADVVVHSASKYLAGHSDVIAGLTATSDPELASRMLAHRTAYGAILGPHEAWLVHRGIRTLGVRLDRAARNARELARRLRDHPAVDAVHHPSLDGDPSKPVADRLWDGYGGMISLTLVAEPGTPSVERADAVIAAAHLVVSATSLGGVETMWERRTRHGEPESVPDSLIRLSVGIEDVEDIWADLDAALSA
ncbi:aminotransferase class I/II-fold pyridoxal phosphate-dependent enzyme [Spelaeicoccus albus]